MQLNDPSTSSALPPKRRSAASLLLLIVALAVINLGAMLLVWMPKFLFSVDPFGASNADYFNILITSLQSLAMTTSLFSGWFAATGPWRRYFRVPILCLGWAVTQLLNTMLLRNLFEDVVIVMPWEIFGLLAIVNFVAAIGTFLLFAMLNWKLSDVLNPSTVGSRRFSIRHLFIWTAGIAITLGAGRWLLPYVPEPWLQARSYLVFAIMFATYLCILIPAVWAFLDPKWSLRRRLISFAIAFGVVAVIVGIAVTLSMIYSAPLPLFTLAAGLGPVYVPFYLVTIFSLLVVRKFGFLFASNSSLARAPETPETESLNFQVS